MRKVSSDTVETTTENAAFAFIQELAQGLSRREIELPSFPDVAIRVRRVLSDEDVSARDVVRVVGSEPALAARVAELEHEVRRLRAVLARIAHETANAITAGES